MLKLPQYVNSVYHEIVLMTWLDDVDKWFTSKVKYQLRWSFLSPMHIELVWNAKKCPLTPKSWTETTVHLAFCHEAKILIVLVME